MNQFSLLPVVSVDRGRPVASSLDVASYFGKRHDHVLRDIRGLLRTEPNGQGGLPKSGESLKSFARSNFVLGTYRNVQNKEHPIYLMTKNGFVLLVMGFSGPKALEFKLAYIAAFDAMEERLRRMNDGEAAARGRLEAAFRLAGSRAALADAALALLEEGCTQREAGGILGVSRHVVYRLKRRFGFLAAQAPVAA